MAMFNKYHEELARQEALKRMSEEIASKVKVGQHLVNSVGYLAFIQDAVILKVKCPDGTFGDVSGSITDISGYGDSATVTMNGTTVCNVSDIYDFQLVEIEERELKSIREL